jgi:hypothetical protein
MHAASMVVRSDHGDKDDHVALEVRQACKAVGITLSGQSPGSSLSAYAGTRAANQPIRCRLRLVPSLCKRLVVRRHGYRSARVG